VGFSPGQSPQATAECRQVRASALAELAARTDARKCRAGQSPQATEQCSPARKCGVRGQIWIRAGFSRRHNLDSYQGAFRPCRINTPAKMRLSGWKSGPELVLSEVEGGPRERPKK